MDDRYDALVVGSGIGGLAAAALLARIRGWRVCVLERHSTAGGFTHTFRRPGGWEWDVGVHYVGEMAEGTMPRRLMDAVTGGSVTWERLPEPFDRARYPGLEFAFGGDEARERADLAALFPAERAGIDAWYGDLRRGARSLVGALMASDLPAPVRWALRKAGLLPDWSAIETTGERLARRIGDPRLRALLASQWGDYGVRPGQSAFPLHALIARHYAHGAWFPRGGGAVLARGAEAVIAEAGGRILRRHTVTRILVESGRAAGVEAVTRAAGQDRTLVLRAPVVISDAGAPATFGRLLPPEFGAEAARRLEPFRAPCSVVSLYLGLTDSPANAGLGAENHWLFDGFDHDAALTGSAWGETVRPAGAFVSVPSLRAGDGRRHTAEIIAVVPANAFAAWRDRPWKDRGADYDALKERIADALLALVERHHPGFSALVAHREVSTPLSVEHFTGHAGGAIYGLPGTAERYRTLGLLGARTAVPGLLLTGADAYLPGVVGAAFGGAAAAGAALGRFGLFKVMRWLRAAEFSPAPSAPPPRRRAWRTGR
ncbi:MAG TPA: NAD(P)/FAD-dependent oxidoreductase [Azospirillum sp.]|nr:NAD(P)/FAD-dependent oxidoreductase [Azospirillum sp.]